MKIEYLTPVFSTNTPTFTTTATQNITIASVGESFGGSVRVERGKVVFNAAVYNIKSAA